MPPSLRRHPTSSAPTSPYSLFPIPSYRLSPHDGAVVLGRLRFIVRFIASSCVFTLATYDLLQQGNLIVRQFRKERPPPLCQRTDATSASLPAKRRTGRGEGRADATSASLPAKWRTGRGEGRADATSASLPAGRRAGRGAGGRDGARPSRPGEDGSRTSCRRGACGRHRPFR